MLEAYNHAISCIENAMTICLTVSMGRHVNHTSGLRGALKENDRLLAEMFIP